MPRVREALKRVNVQDASQYWGIGAVNVPVAKPQRKSLGNLSDVSLATMLVVESASKVAGCRGRVCS